MSKNKILKNKYCIGETVYFYGNMSDSILEVEVRGLKQDNLSNEEPAIYYDLIGNDGYIYYVKEESLFPSETALEASINKIKVGDTVYYFSHNNMKIQRGVVENIIENLLDLGLISIHKESVFKTEKELIKSLRSYDE